MGTIHTILSLVHRPKACLYMHASDIYAIQYAAMKRRLSASRTLAISCMYINLIVDVHIHVRHHRYIYKRYTITYTLYIRMFVGVDTPWWEGSICLDDFYMYILNAHIIVDQYQFSIFKYVCQCCYVIYI